WIGGTIARVFSSTQPSACAAILAGFIYPSSKIQASQQEQRRQSKKYEEPARVGAGGDQHRGPDRGVAAETRADQRDRDAHRGGQQQREQHREREYTAERDIAVQQVCR